MPHDSQPTERIMTNNSLPTDTTWYCIRRNGIARNEGWIGDVTLDDLPNHVGVEHGDTIEVCIASDFQTVPPDQLSSFFYNRVRGIVGLEMAYGDETLRIAPTRMIAANLGFARAVERFRQQLNISVEEFADDGRLRVFSARQVLVPGGSISDRTELYRGSTLVTETPSDGRDRAEVLTCGIRRWMLRNMSEDGALPYKYWPSRGKESPADNAIRRFLASLALERLGVHFDDKEIREAARRNLGFNLKRYFRDIGRGRGAIVEPTGAKLGAAALAALCILESPAFCDFKTEYDMLNAGVNSLADKDMGFRTFFFPPERDAENWNFYSGEALLFWAEAMRHGAPGAPTLERCAETFEKCRERHNRARNPAFVPWHIQACTSLFKQTRRREFVDFVFEISDWLLPMQQWDGMLPDLRGRFYNPKRPEYGPPHAASTGAYLEGLADASMLAQMVGDGPRAKAYRRVVNRGLRSLRQLQFRDACDTYYISKKHRVMGAIRTETYDNSVRVDSAAHALIAAVKWLKSGRTHSVGA
ncbi:MAG: hypothetical protein OXD39_08400 [Gemmatimonadetes bacterium]|nr:hypothetical protein [Gemmatimonadota bacterium]